MKHRFSVSVIIPTYNRAHLLPEAIESLLTQTRIPDEILIIDDGSTDNTPDVLSQYSTPVRVLSQPNSGRSAARNLGLRTTQCDFIAFLDSDDTLPLNSIDQRAAALEAHPEYDAVYGDALISDSDGNGIAKFSERRKGARPSGDIFGELAYHNLAPIHAFMFRRICLQQTGFFDEARSTLEDHDFWLRMAAHYRFLYLDVIVATYRWHEAMTTQQAADQMRLSNIEVQKKAIAMPAFERLPGVQKARILTFLGAKLLAQGEVKEAQSWLQRSLRTNRFHLRTYPYLGLSLLGKQNNMMLNHMRRKLNRG